MKTLAFLLFLTCYCSYSGIAQHLAPNQQLGLETHPTKDAYFIAKFYNNETNILEEQWTMLSTVPNISDENYNMLIRNKKIKANGNHFAFYTSGKILYKWPYKFGIRFGLIQGFYETGETMYEGNSDRFLDGKLTHYFKNGKIKEIENFESGSLSGAKIEYYANGKTKNKSHYLNGIQTGKFVSYHLNGQSKRNQKYKNGELLAEKCFDKNGEETECSPMHISPSLEGGFETIKLAIKNIDIKGRINNNDTVIFRIILNIDSLGVASFNRYYFNKDKSYSHYLNNWANNLPSFTPYIHDGIPEKSKINVAFAIHKNKIIWPTKVSLYRRTSRNQSNQQEYSTFYWDFTNHIPKYNVLFVADKMPQFPGNDEALQEFLSSNLKYPADARKKQINGKVTISFIVNKEGKLKSFRVIRSAHELIDEEALRLAKLMPNWVPGEHNNRIATVQVIRSFEFIGKAKIKLVPSIKPQIKY